jgi:protein-L-isoaspartate(D-aspartate) O-methyltransferase
VYTIEIVPELGEMARANLDRLGYSNISTKIGDGYQGSANSFAS